MPSDIDELLERLRREQERLTETIVWEEKYGDKPPTVAKMIEDVQCLFRYIAAVEELVAFKASHTPLPMPDKLVVIMEDANGDPINP